MRINYRFEKVKLFHCMSFTEVTLIIQWLAWHTLYVTLPSDHKLDALDLLT